jgi:hypothetical protein
MRYMALMSFEIEAEDHDQAMTRLKDLRQKIETASQRLGIGFKPGTMTATPQPPPSLKSGIPRQVPCQ